MLSQYIRLILPARCKCTGLKAQKLNLWSKERSIRWTIVLTMITFTFTFYICLLTMITFTDIITFRFPSLQSWQWVTRRWSGLSKTRWAQLPSRSQSILSNSLPFGHHCCDSLLTSSTINIPMDRFYCHQVCVEGEKYSLVQSNGTFTITINQPEASDTGRYKWY